MSSTDAPPRTPQPGDGVTFQIGTDRYAGTVIKVSASGKTIWWTPDETLRSGDTFVSVPVEPRWPNPDDPFDRGNVREARWSRKRGCFQPKGSTTGRVSVGHRDSYRDPHL